MSVRSFVLCTLLVGCGVENGEVLDAERVETAGEDSATVSPASRIDIDSTTELTATVSCYGPGLYGNKTACGQILRADTIGVAHKTKACGTSLQFRATNGTYVTAKVGKIFYDASHANTHTACTSHQNGHRLRPRKYTGASV